MTDNYHLIGITHLLDKILSTNVVASTIIGFKGTQIIVKTSTRNNPKDKNNRIYRGTESLLETWLKDFLKPY